jgi:hypothetical protein
LEQTGNVSIEEPGEQVQGPRDPGFFRHSPVLIALDSSDSPFSHGWCATTRA